MKKGANLLKKALLLLTENDVKMHSLTFDGAYVNAALCNTFGSWC